MIKFTKDGVDYELEYPNEYDPDLQPTKKKHLIMNKGMARYSNNSKYIIKLGWKYLTEAQKDVIVDLFEDQFVDFKTVTFTFTGIRSGERDLGPIEVFIDIDYQQRVRNNNKFNIRIVLNET